MKRILLLGTDSSHTPAFARVFKQDLSKEVFVARLPEGEFNLLSGRERRFLLMLNEAQIDHTNLEYFESSSVQGVCVLAANGYNRKEHIEVALKWKVPIFVDKPFALSVEEAQSSLHACEEQGVPVFSTSAIRYAQAFQQAMHQMKGQFITHFELWGPLEWLSHDYHYSWYGIHLFELVVACLGTEFDEVTCERNADSHHISVHWKDGRRADLHFHLTSPIPFSGNIVGNITATEFEIKSTDRPFYASLVDEINRFFETGISPVATEDLLAVIRLVQMAGDSYKKTDNSALSVVHKG